MLKVETNEKSSTSRCFEDLELTREWKKGSGGEREDMLSDQVGVISVNEMK